MAGPVRAPASPCALLVPMLLTGGCGYEDFRFCSPVAVEHRL